MGASITAAAMNEYEPLLPTHNYNVQPPDGRLCRWSTFQGSLGHCVTAAQHTVHTTYELVENSEIISVSCQLKEMMRRQPQAVLCIFVSCAQICVTLLCKRLETLLPHNTFVGTYLLATSVLEGTGKLAWTRVSCAFDRSIQLRAARHPDPISVMDRRALSKSESFDSWGHTVFFKFVPTTVSLIFISAEAFLTPCLALATILALRQVTVQLGFSTPVHVLEKKDIRNERFKSLDHDGLELAQSEFAAARTGRVAGGLLRQGFLASVILGVCLVESRRTSTSAPGGIVVGMIFKDVLSLDTHVEKLSKSWSAPRRMLELAESISE